MSCVVIFIKLYIDRVVKLGIESMTDNEIIEGGMENKGFKFFDVIIVVFTC